jgi:hypothetical protein
VFETIEINDPVFEPALAAELGAQPSATQEVPRLSFGIGLAAPQFANALGWDVHGPSIAGLRRRVRSGSSPPRSNPSPVPRRLERAPSRDTLSPRERAGRAQGTGQFINEECRNSRPPRKRGSTSDRVDSRYRGNDVPRVTLERASKRILL